MRALAPSSIAGYRTVLVNTLLEVAGTDLSGDSHLSSLITQFQLERPRSNRLLPQWNLALVLRRLLRAPFEPLRSAPPWALAYKTSFLVALATAKRRGELCAFLSKVLHSEGWQSVTLRPDPIFVAKTEKPGKPETRLQEVTIQGLSSFLGDDFETDKLNCPVRAIKIYLSRTHSVRAGRKHLFIPYKEGAKGDLRPPTISSWIQKCIRYAYTDVSEEEALLGQVRAHDLRAQATSWNLHHSISLNEILRAAQWRSHTTFTSFYLRDMSMFEDDILRLGPLVTAQVITGSSVP